MSPSLATLAFAALIVGLFWMDRDYTVRSSAVRWIPGIWLWVAGSRSALEWLQAARRDQRARTSIALWLPVIWLSLSGSRSVSEWLQSAPPGTPEALLEGDPINRLTYASLIALGLLVLVSRGPKVLKLLQANGIIVVFLLYAALSLAWSEYPDVGLKRWVKTVGDFIMVLIVASEKDPAIAIKRLLARTGFLLIPLSVLLIKYYPELARYYDRWDWSTYYSGVTTNKNALGVICLIFGLASAWQFLAALSGRQRIGRARRLIAHGLMLAMVIWLFRHAHSMTSLAGFLIGIGALLAAEFRMIARQPTMVHAAVAFLIVVPSTILFTSLGAGLLLLIGKDPTLTDRTLVWDLLLSLTTSHWLGTGFETFWLGHRLEAIWRVYGWGPTQAHNGYLEIFLNLGWVGIALLITILFRSYRNIVAGLLRSPTGNLMLAYFVVGIVYNFTEAAFFRISAPIWFVLLLAMTKVPVPHLKAAKQQVLPGRGSTRRKPAAGLGAVARSATMPRLSGDA
jgi:O-antigen ligase